MKTKYLTLNKDFFKTEDAEKKLLLVIQLTRLISALRINPRILYYLNDSQLGQEDNEKLPFVKSILDLSINQSAILYEALKHYKEILYCKEKIYDFVTDEKLKIKISDLYSTILNKTFDQWNLIKIIRDKISFHFDKDIVLKYLKKIDKEENFRLGEFDQYNYQLPINKDIIYSAIDNNIIIPIIKQYYKSDSYFQDFSNEIFSKTDELTNFFERIILSLLGDYYYII